VLSQRIRFVLLTVCATALAAAFLAPSRLGIAALGRALNIVEASDKQPQAEADEKRSSKVITQEDEAPLPPSNSLQIEEESRSQAPKEGSRSLQPEEESRRQKIQSTSDTSIPEVPSFAPPVTTSSTTSTTVLFNCTVRVFQTNSVVPIYYRIEVAAEDGRSVSAKISHDDEVEIFDIAIINKRGSILVKSFSRTIPTVEVFSTDASMNTHLGCRT
jgi:hypothetical protein